MKPKTQSFANKVATPQPKKFYSPDKRTQGKPERDQNMYRTRFKKKDLYLFEPQYYVTAHIKIEDVIDLKQVFDTYDSTGMGVLLPNDLNLLLSQNGFNANKSTIYQILAEFDSQGTGGMSFGQFIQAISSKPYINENKRQIISVFRKYDRKNKSYIDLDDLRQINRLTKQNLDQETLKLMFEKADSNQDGKISFQDFYSVMVKNHNL